ncbi:MAG TPA: AraC family transcriptional regulator [Candidatus Polarisedimenticolia bacterium]|nr:AraC family transcriptional regulator [Candidatus Polarisedimenticolia bacterium]
MDERLSHGNVTAGGAADAPSPRSVCAAEEEAVRRLALLDLPGARAAMESAVAEAAAETDRFADLSHIFFSLLIRLDRVVAEQEGLTGRGLRERLALVRHLAAASDTEDLIHRFWSAYDEVTGTLGSIAPPGHPAVEQVKVFVRSHYTSKIALAEIARAVGVSRNYLSHLFKRHCGVTVTEFIHRTRMREAEKLLLNGRRTVSEIAYTVGYQNYRDFHRNFVKYQNTSPKKFRQVRALTRRAPATASS